MPWVHSPQHVSLLWFTGGESYRRRHRSFPGRAEETGSWHRQHLLISGPVGPKQAHPVPISLRGKVLPPSIAHSSLDCSEPSPPQADLVLSPPMILRRGS
ncbi:unnamed protein product [Rangifer tarandus platyrhynchus]|uniref:Uncharacterized protein n=1 Tax=Rangifer tarandus platyrhynchus TaxID=3082113 RepID=A0AC59ZUX5_RANTA